VTVPASGFTERLHGTFPAMLEQRILDGAGDDVLLGGGFAPGITR
jgi:hypothetical protein